MATKELRSKQMELVSLQKTALSELRTNPSMFNVEKYGVLFPYEASLLHTLFNGFPKFDRTGTDTIGIHGYQSRFDLTNGFPLITTKKVFLKGVIHELLWLLKGDTNIKYLADHDVKIWHDWPLKNYNQNHEQKISINDFHERIKSDADFAKVWGNLGPVYGKQWRNWEARIPGLGSHVTRIDQIQQVVDQIQEQHETGVISRRMLVSAWNVGDLPAMLKSGLPPCHCLFQFHSRLMTLQERKDYYQEINKLEWAVVEIMNDDDLDAAKAPMYALDLQLYQRSCDSFLGVPFNIASYSLLLMMMAQVTNTKPGVFIHDYGDYHIYQNHLDKIVTQLSREPRPYPTMKIKNRNQKIDEFDPDDFELTNYNPHPAIKAEVAV